MNNAAANDNRIEATVTKANGQITYRNLKNRDSKRFGRVYEGAIAKGQHAMVEPNKRIVLWGVDRNTVKGIRPYRLEFNVGDSAVYGSYNLVYTGTITAIGEKTITITERTGTVHRLSIYEFNWRNNDFDADEIFRANSETMMCI
jgi:hypothetical protein